MRVRKQGPWTAPSGPPCGMKKGEGFRPPPSPLVVRVVGRKLADIEHLLAIVAVQHFRMTEHLYHLMVKVTVLRHNELYAAHLDSLTSS